MKFQIHIFYNNLVANATGLNFGKPPGLELTAKILNNFDPSQNNELEKFMFPNVKKVLKFQKQEQIHNSIMYFMLKRKLQNEKIEHPAI